jgi:glycosyltransferase involved in cell wall biosynthesis
MKIVFLLERPSQFDAPLFRLASADAAHEFEAWFLDPRPGGPVLDAEIGGKVSWGSDPTFGYRSRVVPPKGRADWFSANLSGVDLLIVNGYTKPAYRNAARAARRRSVRSTLRIDSVRFPADPAPSLARRLLVGRLIARRFDGFLTTGSLGRRYLAACGVPESRVGLFPYAVDEEAFASAASGDRESHRARWRIGPGRRAVLAVTKLSEREVPWDLVEAARATAPSERMEFLVAGDGPLRAEVAARVEGIGGVRLLGYVPYLDLPSLYAAADLFVHPVREERWGVSVAEALACGLPVVTSDRVGASYDLLTLGRNGGRYPVGDSGALGREIRAALALDRGAVRDASRPALAEFGLEATWRGIVEMAERSRR